MVAPGDEGEAVDAARTPGSAASSTTFSMSDGGQVVDDEPAEVLHHVGDSRASRARQAR